MTDFQPLVAIGIPSGDMVHADFAMTLATLCLNPGARTFIVNAKSSLVMVGRNHCVAAAQAAKATHLLFIDSDMTFPLDLIPRLLRHNKDIVGVVCSRRTPPFHPLGVTYEGECIHITSGLRRMKVLPTGCVMIRLNVFDKIEKPYFNTVAEGDNILGEDYFFAKKADAAGFELWCDGDLSCEIGHIGQKVYKLERP